MGLYSSLKIVRHRLAMARSGFEYILSKHVVTAAEHLPSIATKLGHACLQSTEACLRADPTEKLEALAAPGASTLMPGKFRPTNKLIDMLKEQCHCQDYAE